MENKRYDINDIEGMLTPRAEFRASSDLKWRIMEETIRDSSAATVQEQKNEETGRKGVGGAFGFRFLPWMAAACVGGVILLLAILPTSKKTDNTLLAGNDAKSVATVSLGEMGGPSAGASDNNTSDSKVSTLSRQEEGNTTGETFSRKNTHRELAKSPAIDQTLNESGEEVITSNPDSMADGYADNEDSRNKGEALYGRNTITLVREEDIPVRWGNFILTEEEMILAEKQYQLEFLSQMTDELEITAQLIMTYNNILEYE